MKYLNILLFLFLSTIVTQSYAAVIADISVENNDGVIIYYNYINDGMELEVTCRSISGWYGSSDYSGNVNIPEEVTYMNRTRKVTAIGHYAFQNCGKLTSVTIPSSVTSIDYGAFHDCGFSGSPVNSCVYPYIIDSL